MNFHHLRYFLAVARAGGFTRAARDLHVTQPTVSSGIAELERDVGVRLFNWTSRHVELTLEGRTLMAYALQLEDLVSEAEDLLGNGLGHRFEGSLSFGSIDAAVIYLLPDILRKYHQTYPDVDLSIQVAPSRYLVDELLANRTEFALITLPFEHSHIEVVTLLSDPMPLVVGEDHPFAARRTVTAGEVAAEHLILFPADSVSRKLVNEAFAEAAVLPRVVMEMRSPEAMRKLVESGVGISFLPHMSLQESLESGALQIIQVEGMSFSRDVGLAWRRGRYFGPAIRQLLEAILMEHDALDEWLAAVDAASELGNR